MYRPQVVGPVQELQVIPEQVGAAAVAWWLAAGLEEMEQTGEDP